MKSLNQIRFLIALLMLVTLFSSAGVLLAQDTGLVTVQSKSSFNNTVDAFRKMVAKNQIMVMAEVNHGKILSMTGLKLNGMSLFIGSPTVGKKLFSANKGVGVAVPIRVNIYQDDDGKTYINYTKPSAQLAAFGNKKINMVAKMLDGKLQNLTSMLSK